MDARHIRSCRLGSQTRWSLAWAAVVFLTLQAVLGATVRAGWLPVHDLVFADKAALLNKHRCAFSQGKEQRPFSILTLGSSRPMCGLRADQLGEQLSRECQRRVFAFNFGIPAAGPITTNLYLRRLLAHGIRPDFVVIEILPPFLAGHLGQPMEAKWLQPHRLLEHEFALVESWGYPLPHEDSEAWEHWLAGTHLYRSALLSRGLPKWVPYEQLCDARSFTDAFGWARTPTDEVTPAQYEKGLSIARKQYRQALTDFTVGGPACTALDDMLTFCRDESIPSALLLMPEGADFREWYTDDASKRIDAYLNELSARHEVPLIDARRWVPDDSFADAHHLLPRGAARFTDRLAAELQRLGSFGVVR